MLDDKQVTNLAAMAFAMDVDRSVARRWLLRESERMGIMPVRSRDPQHRQKVLAWVKADAESLLRHRKALGFPMNKENTL